MLVTMLGESPPCTYHCVHIIYICIQYVHHAFTVPYIDPGVPLTFGVSMGGGGGGGWFRELGGDKSPWELTQVRRKHA